MTTFAFTVFSLPHLSKEGESSHGPAITTTKTKQRPFPPPKQVREGLSLIKYKSLIETQGLLN